MARPQGDDLRVGTSSALPPFGLTIRETDPMMMQLNPPIPLDTPKGPAFAHMTIDYSQDHYVLFVCFLVAPGECWVFPNKDVRLQKKWGSGPIHPVLAMRMPSGEERCHSQRNRHRGPTPRPASAGFHSYHFCELPDEGPRIQVRVHLQGLQNGAAPV